MDRVIVQQIFIILTVVGLVLVGAEIFVPGGILGTMGAVALIGAIIAAFSCFGPVVGGYIAIAIVVLVAVSIILWARFFPKTALGKKMTVSNDLAAAKGTEAGLEDLINKEGVASSELRPAGYAKIDGRRVDVVTQGGMLNKGDAIKVIEIEGNRVVVKKIEN